jgi:hypothetical protein
VIDHANIAIAMGGDDLQVNISIYIGDDHAGPDTSVIHRRGDVPPLRAVFSIEDKKRVGSPNYLQRAITVQVDHSR